MLTRRRLSVPTTAVLVGVLLAALAPAGVAAAGPIAGNDEFTVGVNALQATLDVLANDTDPDGDSLRVIDVTEPAHGSASPSIDGTAVVYEPDATFHGIDTFDYLVDDGALGTASGTVTVTVNDPPVAVDDPGAVCGPSSPPGNEPFGGAFPLPEDYVGDFPPTDYFILICGLLANDSDPNGDPLTWEIYTDPAHGDVIKFDETFFGYRPDPDYSTQPGDEPGGEWISDSFTYRAYDGLSYSQPATMRYWVAPINDAPSFTPGGDIWVVEDSGTYSATWATDISPGPANESDQTVNFELRGTSGVAYGAPGPIFVTLPAIDSDGTLTFTLRPGVYGEATVTFGARDDGGTLPDYTQNTRTPKADDTADDVTFKIFIASNAVDAADDVVAFPEDHAPSPWLIPVLVNDTYPAGAGIDGVSPATLGSATISADGQAILYTPHPNANGEDSFTYSVSDGVGGVDSATVFLSVTPVNDAPVAVDDVATVARNAPATAIPVLGNDVDVDGESLRITARTSGSKGQVVITGGGTGLTYLPNKNATGTDSFTYTITDAAGASATATVQVTIPKPGHNP